MSGKVFKDSKDVIQDQAKILYDYLRSAAQKIVAEEMRIEDEIAAKKEEREQNNQIIKKKQMIMIAGFAAAGILLLALLVLLFLKKDVLLLFIFPIGFAAVGVMGLFGKADFEKKNILANESIKTFEEAHRSIRRDYKVHRMGVVYVPVAKRIPFEGKSFLLDHTQSVPSREFSLYSLKDQDSFIKNIQQLENALDEIPMVEGTQYMEEVDTGDYSKSIQQISYYDYLGGIDRNMRAASYYLNDLERNSVSIPVIDPKSSYAQFLNTYSTTESKYGPVVEIFPTDANKADLEQFQGLNEMKKSMEGQTAQFEDFLKGLMDRLASTIQLVTTIKMSSTDHIVNNANQVLFTSLKSSYNHYSPQLEAEEIDRIRGERFDYQESADSYRPFELKKSSRVLYDALSGNWVSEDGRRTNFPFGVYQIHEEVIAPLVQNLMRETRIERLKIYNSIKDQKLDYLNQWHRDTDDFYGRNRAQGSDLINLMQGSLTEFTAAFNQYKAFEETLKSMASSGSIADAKVEAKGSLAESIAVYEKKSEDFRKIQTDFNDYSDRLKEEIDRKAVEFGYIEFFDASLRDAGSRDFASSMARIDSLDDRRKSLLAVNPYFAETAELPPQPDLGEEVQKGLSINLMQMVQNPIESLFDNEPAAHQQKIHADGVKSNHVASDDWKPPEPPGEAPSKDEDEWAPPPPPPEDEK